jgi:hypothetical protein
MRWRSRGSGWRSSVRRPGRRGSYGRPRAVGELRSLITTAGDRPPLGQLQRAVVTNDAYVTSVFYVLWLTAGGPAGTRTPERNLADDEAHWATTDRGHRSLHRGRGAGGRNGRGGRAQPAAATSAGVALPPPFSLQFRPLLVLQRQFMSAVGGRRDGGSGWLGPGIAGGRCRHCYRLQIPFPASRAQVGAR